MTRQYLFVANWKMYLPFNQAIEFATSNYDELVNLAKPPSIKIVLCPSFESLYPIIQMFKSTTISIGAQDCSPHSNGAFTSQISPQSLQEIGCSYCIVGHSENRSEYNATDESIANKCIHLLDYDITPIFCIGETKEEYKKNKTIKILEQQLEPLFKAICNKTTVHSYLTPYIAYEPIWAIGKDESAPTEHIDMVCSWMRDHITKNCPSIPWKLMYGGSISHKNIAKLKQINKIDGFLIGKSSLNFQNFQKIVQLGVTG